MRKRFAVAAAIICAMAVRGVLAAETVKVDYKGLVSRADLDYDRPATRSEEGMPVGNGRMGSLVWTTPSAMHFQINRVDVFGEDSSTVSFPKQDSDYASGCGYVDINLASSGGDVFTDNGFKQHLSCYDGRVDLMGSGVTARVIAWPAKDVIAVEVDDERAQPEAVNIDLRMLRFGVQNITNKNWELVKEHAVELHTAEHTALSDLGIEGNNIVLAQTFKEGDFCSKSAVAIGVVGREAKTRYLNETTVQLSAAAGKGKFVILIGTAANPAPDADVGKAAIGELDAARGKAFDALATETAAWWHDYWAKGFVSMHSGDGQADFVEQNYTYYLYVMGASSRGKYPPRFGGMLWYTNGDMRRWGSQYWWANESCLYVNLLPANRLEIMDPMYSLYDGMVGACAQAAKQQWGAEGIWIPEINFFNGPEKLPDDIATEMRDLMLVKKPYDQRSQQFQWWVEVKNRHNSRYNFEGDGHFEHGHLVVPTKGRGIFGHCTHIMSVAARVGNLFLARYEYTGDQEWLREKAWPIVRGAAEFYRTFPNTHKGEDGKWHIDHVNNGEAACDFSDTPNEIAGMKMAFGNAVRVSKILGIDEELRAKWADMLPNLAEEKEPPRTRARPVQPRAPGEDTGTTQPTTQQRELRRRVFGSFVYGGPGAIPPLGDDQEQKSKFLGFNATGSWIDPIGGGGAQIFRNRMRLREGPGATDVEHIAGLTMGIHSTLLPSKMGDDGAAEIEVLNKDWPRSWDCSFSLLARGGFVVTSSIKNREIGMVEVESQLGGVCRIKNPWVTNDVDVWRKGKKAESAKGESLAIKTEKGEDVLLVKAGVSPASVRSAVP